MKILSSCNYVCFLLFQNVIGITSSPHELSYGKYLHGFVVDRVNSIGLNMCIKDCKLRSDCRSINYNRLQLTCELNSVSISEHVDSVINEEWSVMTDVEKDSKKSNCSSYCGEQPSLCIDSLFKTEQDETCIPISNDIPTCMVPEAKNAFATSRILRVTETVTHMCMPGYVGLNVTQRCLSFGTGVLLYPPDPRIKCYKLVYNNPPMMLIFRAQHNLNISVYKTWRATGTSHETDPAIDTSCEILGANGDCSVHYRTSIIDDWENLPINRVMIGFYNNEYLNKQAVFDAVGTHWTNWFVPERLNTSSWSTMTSQRWYARFSIDGTYGTSFEATSRYDTCYDYLGYFVVMEGHEDCILNTYYTAYPKFVYCPNEDECRYKADKQLESNPSWLLIFRAQKSLGISVYDTWYSTGTSHETDPAVDTSCEGLVYSSNCSVHYRTSIIDKWGTFSVEKVRIAFYKSSENEQLENRAEFDAINTSNTSWFSPQKLLSSTWSTMLSNETYRIFAILGTRTQVVRSFEVTSRYGNCPGDLGYFVTIDGPGDCEFDQHPTYPQFLVCLTADKCLFQTEGSYADVMAIYVKSDFLKD